VWYNGEDNPEITAALEEERASNLNKKNSPRAKRGKAYTPKIIISLLHFAVHIYQALRYDSWQWVAEVEGNCPYAHSKLNS
jgi:hypothetical protein